MRSASASPYWRSDGSWHEVSDAQCRFGKPAGVDVPAAKNVDTTDASEVQQGRRGSLLGPTEGRV